VVCRHISHGSTGPTKLCRSPKDRRRHPGDWKPARGRPSAVRRGCGGEPPSSAAVGQHQYPADFQDTHNAKRRVARILSSRTATRPQKCTGILYGSWEDLSSKDNTAMNSPFQGKPLIADSSSSHGSGHLSRAVSAAGFSSGVSGRRPANGPQVIRSR